MLATAIIKLAEDNALCRNMGMNGYEFVRKNYDWEKSLDMMEDLYCRLVERERKTH